MEYEYAACWVCGRPTSQQVVSLEQPDVPGGSYLVPVYHKECVPDHKKAGVAGRKRRID